MVIFKMELVEGPELFYENPFKTNVVIGADAESLKENPRNGFPLAPGESISLKATQMYIRVLEI